LAFHLVLNYKSEEEFAVVKDDDDWAIGEDVSNVEMS
jgi:hypothetical protein